MPDKNTPDKNQDTVYIYDSTLRDGAQTKGIDFSVVDKQAISVALDKFGIDYIEGGWPGANPTDDEFFNNAPKLQSSKLSIFGMTRKNGVSADNDPNLRNLIDTAQNNGHGTITIVGKCSKFQVEDVLGITPEQNIAMIADSIKLIKSKGIEPIFDAEHFFDGYKANKEYTLNNIKAAHQAGARWIVLCDTNGGMLPHEIYNIVQEVSATIEGKYLGIHCHNDTGNANANSLAAVRAGVRQVQGTINGIGERCGNANLTTIIPNLMLKLGFKTNVKNLADLTSISRMLDERLNRQPNIQAPYVGAAAFAHKGGLHVSAIAKTPKAYEHIDPQVVGNAREILISNQAGRSNFKTRLDEMNIDYSDNDKLNTFIADIKELEKDGFSYDGADASFEILARTQFSSLPTYFKLESFRVSTERRYNEKDELTNFSEATVKVYINDKKYMAIGEGNGPVNALDMALREALANVYPTLNELQLVDYKVRIINPKQGTNAKIRVLIESIDQNNNRWSTVGLSDNIIDASYYALRDSIYFKLLNEAKNNEA